MATEATATTGVLMLALRMPQLTYIYVSIGSKQKFAY